MATTYHFYKQGYAVPYDTFGHVLLRKHLDVPAIIASGAAGYSPLAVAGVRTALASTGFAATDILQLWRVPAGTLLIGGGFKVTTAGSATTIDIGNISATETMALGAEKDRWLDACAVAEDEYNFDTEDGDEWATVTAKHPLQTLYITNGSVDLTFNGAAEKTLIADFWMFGYKVY